MAAHPVAGRALRLPVGPVAVGGAGDPARCRHTFVCAGPLFATRLPFVTMGAFRAMTSSGRWHEAALARAGIRPPDQIVDTQDLRSDRPIEGLTYAEAALAAYLLGARLPLEKELDLLVEQMGM